MGTAAPAAGGTVGPGMTAAGDDVKGAVELGRLVLLGVDGCFPAWAGGLRADAG